MSRITFYLLVALFLPSMGFSQFSLPRIPPIIPLPIDPPRARFRIPTLNEPTNRFAYLERIGDTQFCRIAKIENDGIFLEARDIVTISRFDLDFSSDLYEEVHQLIASPSNRWVAVYTLQEFYGLSDGFTDYNLEVYDLIDGTHKAFLNEHSFSSLNESVTTSQRLEEFRQAERDLGVPDNVVATYNYSVETEGVTPYAPTFQWNADGTFTYFIELEVYVDFGNSYSDFIGTEVFSQTIAITPTGFTRLGFNLPTAPATDLPVLDLTPDHRTSEFAKLEGWYLQFVRYDFTLNGRRYFSRSPKTVTLTEGNIPRAFHTFYF